MGSGWWRRRAEPQHADDDLRAEFFAAFGGEDALRQQLEERLREALADETPLEVDDAKIAEVAADAAASLAQTWARNDERGDPQALVDAELEALRGKLRAQYGLNCCDFFFIPPFIAGFTAIVVDDESRVNGWWALLVGVGVSLVLSGPWIWLRKKGLVTMETD